MNEGRHICLPSINVNGAANLTVLGLNHHAIIPVLHHCETGSESLISMKLYQCQPWSNLQRGSGSLILIIYDAV